jgi:hypothetical protein
MASSSSGDNLKGIYEYHIDSEIFKLGKSLFKFVSRTGRISWIQDSISEVDYLFSAFFEQEIEFEETINEITIPQE